MGSAGTPGRMFSNESPLNLDGLGFGSQALSNALLAG